MRDEVRKIVGASYPCNGKPSIPGAWDLGGWCCEEKALEMYDRIQELSAHFACSLACVELGVYEGKSLFVQAHALKSSPHGGTITGIDPYTIEANAEGFDLDDKPQREHVEWWSTSAALPNAERRCRLEIMARQVFWCEVRKSMPDDVADEYEVLHWLHLDDCHSPTASLRNAQTWVPKVLPGGIVVVDDIHWPTMQPAREWIAERLEMLAENAAEGMQWAFFRVPTKPVGV